MGRNQKIAVASLGASVAAVFALVMLGKVDGPAFVSFLGSFVPTMVGIALGASAAIKVGGAIAAGKDDPGPE